jgi:hypothetical protein
MRGTDTRGVLVVPDMHKSPMGTLVTREVTKHKNDNMCWVMIQWGIGARRHFCMFRFGNDAIVDLPEGTQPRMRVVKRH